MRKQILLSILMFVGFSLSAQILDPVKWSFTQNQISDDYIELEFNAKIDSGWHLYSQFTGQYYNDEGPIPTSFVFNTSDFFIRDGVVNEESPIEDYDIIWDDTLKYYKKNTVFKQKIKLLTEKPFNIEGEINFMLCDAEQCIFPMPLQFNFSINLMNLSSKTFLRIFFFH